MIIQKLIIIHSKGNVWSIMKLCRLYVYVKDRQSAIFLKTKILFSHRGNQFSPKFSVQPWFNLYPHLNSSYQMLLSILSLLGDNRSRSHFWLITAGGSTKLDWDWSTVWTAVAVASQWAEILYDIMNWDKDTMQTKIEQRYWEKFAYL
jgi:hypothetical protein